MISNQKLVFCILVVTRYKSVEEVLLHARESSSYVYLIMPRENCSEPWTLQRSRQSEENQRIQESLPQQNKKQNVYDWSFWREIRDGNREKLF